jgi:RNA polymerase sigma factor (sigma-70 family)
MPREALTESAAARTTVRSAKKKFSIPNGHWPYGPSQAFLTPTAASRSPATQAVHLKCWAGCGQVRGMDESDADLLAATARGDAEAFGRFYRRHEPRVLGYAITRCANADDVADLIGETFLAALGSAARFRDDGGDAIPWLFGIARRVLAHQRRSFVRRQRLIHRLERLPSLDPDEAEAVEAAIDAARLAPRLAAAMAALRPKDRELLRLVGGDGLSPAQAGAVLGVNANTARIRLSRARARLQGLLDTTGRQSPSDPHLEAPHAQR